jgi:hypothetical protein
MFRIEKTFRLGPRRSIRVTVVAAALAIVAGAWAPTHANGIVELRDGVVIDPGAQALYVMNPDGGIDAVSLASGTTLWHSDEAERPIAASAAGILAQADATEAGVLKLALLDRSGRLLESTTVTLPDGAEAPVTDGLSHRFLIRGVPTDNGRTFEVVWQSTYLAPRGALILDGDSTPRIHAGATTFDATSGETSLMNAPPDPFPGPRIHVPESSRADAEGRQYFSAGGGHLLASVGDTSSDIPAFEWTILDSSGARLGSFTNRVEYSPFYVGDGLVVYESRPGAWREGDRMVEQPLAVRAISLRNGGELWSISIRDTEFRGPFPP